MQLDQPSLVYGVIKTSASTAELEKQRVANKQAIGLLPGREEWPLIAKDMFSLMPSTDAGDALHTDVFHFASTYKGVEYEWDQWIKNFEQLLKSMYWDSVTVHLETEFNGRHTFNWESDEQSHQPDDVELSVRCEWTREAVNF